MIFFQIFFAAVLEFLTFFIIDAVPIPPPLPVDIGLMLIQNSGFLIKQPAGTIPS